jgi:hypothetical protein
VPLFDALKMMSPAIVIGVVSAILMGDKAILVLVLALAYTCVLFFGRLFSEYEVDLPDTGYLRDAERLLDDTKALHREGSDLYWRKRTSLPFLRSKADDIVILKKDSGWIARGRRFDILSLTAALNRRAG